MRRIVSIFISISLLTGLAMPSTIAGVLPKIGGACTRLNSMTAIPANHQRLICIKSGKKFIWSALQQTNSTLVAQASQQGAQVFVDPIRQSAFDSVHSWSCGTSHPHITVEKLIGANYPSDIKSLADSELERTLNCFDSFFDTNIKLNVVFVTEKDSEIVQKSLPSIIGDQETSNLVNNVLNRYASQAWGPTGGSGGGSAGFHQSGNNYFYVLHNASYSTAKTFSIKTVMHEFTHILQNYGRRNASTPTAAAYNANLPGYFIEGGAESLGYAFSSSTAANYSTQISNAANGMTKAFPAARNFKDVSAALAELKITYSPSGDEASNVQYPLGALVCDYILGKYGITKFLDLMKGASTYPLWEENLQANLGISRDSLESAALTWGLPLWNAATK